jgi:hypothetical protein
VFDFPIAFQPETFVATLVGLVGGSGVWTWAQRLGITLAALFFLYNLYMALASQSGQWVTDAIIRAAVVGAALANGGVIVDAMIALHQAFSAIGQLALNAFAGPQVFDEVLAAIQAARDAVMNAVGGGLLGTLRALPVLFVTWIPLLLFFLFMAIAMAIYNFLLFGSYLMLGLAVVMMPISVAFFATRPMQRFTYEWFQVVIHSSLVVMLAKAAAGLIANQAVLQPVMAYAQSVQAAAAQGQLAAVDMGTLLTAVIGLAIGIFSLMAVQGIASAFVGRVESVAGSIAAMYVAARYGPALAAGAVSAGAEATRWGAGQARGLADRIRGEPAAAGGPGGVDATLPQQFSPAEPLGREQDQWLAEHRRWEQSVLDSGAGQPGPESPAGEAPAVAVSTAPGPGPLRVPAERRAAPPYEGLTDADIADLTEEERMHQEATEHLAEINRRQAQDARQKLGGRDDDAGA